MKSTERSHTPATRTRRFRELLASPDLEFLMEAHNGLSARIGEEAGFKALWASGLSMSAAMGLRDANEASWTQILEVLEMMADAVDVPIMLDGDTGYGNFNNMRRLVRKLEDRGVAAVCIEDKLFPKTNSFVGERQPLADVEEFCGKIKAGKDSQRDESFSIVARVEALISGWSLSEALRRAERYHAAGADAILIHSKLRRADQIVAFMKEWGRRSPVVIVPTTYAQTPTQVFRDAGVSMAIWANQVLRSAISAMRETAQRIRREQSVAEVEERIASVADVFALQRNDELLEAESRYLPKGRQATAAVVLAASRGDELGELTLDRPKCMVDVRGRPLLRRLLAVLNEGGIGDVTVVRGYRKEAVALDGIRAVDNDDYATTGEAASLALAKDRFGADCIVTYGDIIFRRNVLDELAATAGDIVLAVDPDWQDRGRQGKAVDTVRCRDAFDPGGDSSGRTRLETFVDAGKGRVDGQWIGVARLSTRGASLVSEELERMRQDGTLVLASLAQLWMRLVKADTPVDVVYVTGRWEHVNDLADLADARNRV